MSVREVADHAAMLRRHFMPEFPGPNTVQVLCRRCGGPFLRWVGQKHRYCPDCSRERQLAASTGEHQKAGPDYERWVAQVYAYASREMARLGLLTAEPASAPKQE